MDRTRAPTTCMSLVRSDWFLDASRKIGLRPDCDGYLDPLRMFQPMPATVTVHGVLALLFGFASMAGVIVAGGLVA